MQYSANFTTTTIQQRARVFMDKRINQIILLMKSDMRLMLSISFGVFLFILFFQPFHINLFDFNNRILFVAGFGGIVFILMALARISFHWIIDHYDNLLPSYLSSFVIWTLSTVAFAFYLRFVGNVPITFFIVFKMALICMAPPITIRLRNLLFELQQNNAELKNQLLTDQKEKGEKEQHPEAPIEFISENNTDKLSINSSKVVAIKTANNYVEVIYLKDETIKRKLFRNTLKNVELLLTPHPHFMRTHRTCIVNVHFVDTLQNKANKIWLDIDGLDEKIPVSRQYLLQLKQAL